MCEAVRIRRHGDAKESSIANAERFRSEANAARFRSEMPMAQAAYATKK